MPRRMCSQAAAQIRQKLGRVQTDTLSTLSFSPSLAGTTTHERPDRVSPETSTLVPLGCRLCARDMFVIVVSSFFGKKQPRGCAQRCAQWPVRTPNKMFVVSQFRFPFPRRRPHRPHRCL